jgi:hypothetical protein
MSIRPENLEETAVTATIPGTRMIARITGVIFGGWGEDISSV